MRWDHLRLDEGDGGGAGPVLPLIERGAVARTFDTPEFRGMTFYEIHAKSVINKVPPASRMSFRWTINPYRGCSHACSYCLAGDTPVLLAGGRTALLRDLRPGDRVYGTGLSGAGLSGTGLSGTGLSGTGLSGTGLSGTGLSGAGLSGAGLSGAGLSGAGRRLVETEVLDHWRTRKPAFRVLLGDGTALVASGEHRFLTGRGWCHVAGHAGEPAGVQAAQGEGVRPVLRPGDALIGVGGGFAEPPKHDDDYRRGYLHGLASTGEDDGVGTAPPPLTIPAASFGDAVRERADRFLSHLAAPGAEGPADLFAWPGSASDGWLKGFLAGRWDAGADLERAAARPSSAGDARVGDALARLGLAGSVAGGGLRARLRLLHVLDPARTHAVGVDGAVLDAGDAVRVVSVEPLGVELDLYDITTGTGDFIAGGVVSHNCFARKTHEYLDLDSGADFDSRIVVKVNAAERVRRELAAPKWRGEHIAMGTNVDCYQRAEGRYRLMPGILQALRDAANPFSILTKGSLILRDLPLLLEAAERTEVSTAVSVGFVDRELWRLVEPGTPAPGKRLEVCATLNEAGIGCAVLLAPVLPYLTDAPDQLEAAVRRIAEAGATSVTPITLHLRPGAREWYLSWLREHHPELVVPYARLYGRGAYAPREYQDRIAAQVRDLASKYGIGRRTSPGHRGTRKSPQATGRTTKAAAHPPTPEQLTLPT